MSVRNSIKQAIYEGSTSSGEAVFAFSALVAQIRHQRGRRYVPGDWLSDQLSRGEWQFIKVNDKNGQRKPIKNISRKNTLLLGAGIVLCPIFDPVKHDLKPEYFDRMAEFRSMLSGLSPWQIDKKFRHRIELADDLGAFDSPLKAQELELWRILGGDQF